MWHPRNALCCGALASLQRLFSVRERISLSDAGLSSPSPASSQSGWSRKWEAVCLQFLYFRNWSFPYKFLGVFYVLGEWLFVPTGRCGESINPHNLEDVFSLLQILYYEATINWSITSWLLTAVFVRIWKALIFIFVFRDIKKRPSSNRK